MAPRSASSTAGWVKIRGELALRNVRESRQLGLEALQREQDMPRGRVCIESQGALKMQALPVQVIQECACCFWLRQWTVVCGQRMVRNCSLGVRSGESCHAGYWACAALHVTAT